MRRSKLSINCVGVFSAIAGVYTLLGVIQYRVFGIQALKSPSAKSKYIGNTWPHVGCPGGFAGQLL